MNRITRITAALIGAGALVAVTAVPATAAETTATIEVAGGSLSITAPATLDFGAITADADSGTTSTATLTNIKVEDARAVIGSWSASATLTDFTSASAATAFTAAVTFAPATAVVTGGATVEATSGNGSVVQAGDVTGSNTATWTEGITLTVPQTALAAEDYEATLTHSVL